MNGTSKPRPLLLRYLKGKVRLLAMFAAMVAVFALVVGLYGYPTETVLYASLLAVCVGAFAGGLDFLAFRRRLRALEEARHSILYTMDGLPEASDANEAVYQQLIALLFGEQNRAMMAADKASADLADYYTLWAHQIKTPIAAMDLLLQAGNADPQALKAELFKVERYVEMALGFARLESHQTDYVLRRIPLDTAVRQAVRKYARLFILKGIQLEYEGTDVTVLSDEKWLTFAIEQLLSNAVKYTQAGKVTLTANEHCLVVSDTGMGIAPGDLPRIFDKGFTGYNGREEQRSTGLGLYLCRRVLTALSHTIRVESQQGTGTHAIIGFAQNTLEPE